MAWLDKLFTSERRIIASARKLLDEGRYDDALDLLKPLESEQGAELYNEVGTAAAKHWLDRALDATDQGDGNRLRKVMARAGRYHRPDIDYLYRATDRKIRERRVQLTAPEHWTEVLIAAIHQRKKYFGGKPGLGIPKYQIFKSRRLLRYAAAAWSDEDDPAPLDTEDIERATPEQLVLLIDAIRSMYPDDLAKTIPELGAPFVRAVLQIANGRPDIATLPLLELPESDPLICFERARVAHILGYPNVALLALQNFRILVGDHRTIRRLNTGVFAAQMAVSIGDEGRALHVIRSVPTRFLGKRPLALYARLLINNSEVHEAHKVLEDHISRVSDNADALLLLDEVRTLLRERQDDPVDDMATLYESVMPHEVTVEILVGEGPLFDDLEARTTPEPIPRRASRDPDGDSN